jgi:hypothetical protein
LRKVNYIEKKQKKKLHKLSTAIHQQPPLKMENIRMRREHKNKNFFLSSFGRSINATGHQRQSFPNKKKFAVCVNFIRRIKKIKVKINGACCVIIVQYQ